jgi:hypothetical protein
VIKVVSDGYDGIVNACNSEQTKRAVGTDVMRDKYRLCLGYVNGV